MSRLINAAPVDEEQQMMSGSAYRLWLYCSVVSIVSVTAGESLAQQEFHVGGTTLKMTQPGERYSRMPRIRISAWRQGPVGAALSDDEGVIDLTLPAGTPVKLLFEGPDDYLPQLQSLAAAPDLGHTVHVTLLTVSQAKSLGIDPYQHVKTILDHLRSQGINSEDQQLDRLRKLLQQLS